MRVTGPYPEVEAKLALRCSSVMPAPIASASATSANVAVVFLQNIEKTPYRARER